MKTTKSGQPRKQRTKDNTLEQFPSFMARTNRAKKVASALKAIRRVWKIDGGWPQEEVVDLIAALKEVVTPKPPAEDVLAEGGEA